MPTLRLLSRLAPVAALSLSLFTLPASAGGARQQQVFEQTYAKTQHPIVLVHGLFGFDNIGNIDYFFKIPEALRNEGATVYVVKVSAANSTEVRGEQLLAEVQRILASTGAQKVNIIGHSHGSPTARYVASVRPDLVASVTSVGGVNQGSPVADMLLKTSPPVQNLLNNVVGGVVRLINFLSGGGNYAQAPIEAARSLSTAGTAKFNQAHPAGVPKSGCGEGEYVVKGVAYYSWHGTKPLTNVFDISDVVMGLTSLAFRGEANDGLVGRCSSHLGQIIRDDYRMNHLDEVNQFLGIVGKENPVTLYTSHANRLRNAGL